MSAEVHIRRARRLDFVAVMALLAAGGEPLPPPDRRSLRRFRQVVADLGGDFYIALREQTLVGVVHVTYARRLAAPPLACLDQLVVAAPCRRSGIGAALLAFVSARARQRGCGEIAALRWPAAAPARAFLQANGWQDCGAALVARLEPMD